MEPIKQARRNSIEEMADIIAAVKAGEEVECCSLSIGRPGWESVTAVNFVGNFLHCQYRRKPPKPMEIWVYPSRYGMWSPATPESIGAYHFIEVWKE